MEASILLGRLGATEGLGHAASSVATVRADHVTGRTSAVDGGQIPPESLAVLTGA